MNDMKVKTPFRYPGGKYYALKYLLPYIDRIPHDEYREPFVGGGSVFFGKQKAKVNWINDIDGELVNVYKIFQSKEYTKALNLLTKEVASRDRYKAIKSSNPKSALGRAIRYYYLNRTSYSGKLISSAWGFREKRSIPPERWSEVVMPAHEKLGDVKITSLDFEKVITAPSSQKVLMYIDPPYFLPPKTKHYINGFGKNDHLRLNNLLKTAKFSFVLSYEDCLEIRDLYSWTNIYKLAFPYRVGDSNTTGLKRKNGKEVIITNRKLPEYENLRLF